MSEIESKVKAIIVDKLSVEETEVTNEASFTNDLGADSLDTVELIMEFEKEFGISIPDDQAEKITTVGDAIAYIEANAKLSILLIKGMELKRVVVTGLGAITPLGNTLPETWEGIINGKSGAGPITQFDASKFKTQFACEVKGFDPLKVMDRKEARKCDRYSLFAIDAAKQAIEDAAMDLDNEDKNRIGVIFASGIGGIKTFDEEVLSYAKIKDTIGPKFNPFFIPKMISDIAAGHISMLYGFHGPNFATVSACASSTNAISDAFNYIRLGKANVIITGGAEAADSESGVGGFNSKNALSSRNDSPETASRAFSASRDGFVMCEGGACLVLVEMEHALARGAKIYCEIAGTGMSADAYHLTASHPDGLGAKLVMRNALEDAGMTPEDIDYINVHGTSTPVGDISEVKAIKDVFG